LAYGFPEGIESNIEEVTVPTDMAIPLALIVNELVTNAVKYVGPPCAIGVRVAGSAVKLTVADKGTGPQRDAPRGLGSRMVDAFSKQINAHIETNSGPDGYTVELTIPLPLN
jgi:two-component sensor histidine kinase